MADEQKNPEEEQNVTAIEDETIVEADDAEAITPDYESADEVEEELEEDVEVENDFEESVNEAIVATSEASEDNPVAEAWDEGVKSVMEAAEDVVDSDHESHDHHYTDEVVLPYVGSIGTMPGGIYTFVFGVLAVLTVIEVLLAELFPENIVQISLLAFFSLMKAYLVVMYYMHLKDDNKLYRLVLILPLLIVLVSVLYLLGVPTGAGLGYGG